MNADVARPMTQREAFDRLITEIGQRLNALENVMPNVDDRRHVATQLDRMLVASGMVVQALTHHRVPAMWSTCEVCGAYSLTLWCDRCEVWGETGEWPVAI